MFILFMIAAVIVLSVVTGLLNPTHNANRGQLKDFTFPQVQDGDPIAYLVGTVKITGPGLVWYGDFSTKDIKATPSIFAGILPRLLSGPNIGYKYYLGWQLVFCIGSDVHLKKLWFGTVTGKTYDEQQAEFLAEENNPDFVNPNDPKIPTPIFSGDMTTGTMQKTYLDAFGGTPGGGGYDLSIEFYGGENTQPASAYLASKIPGGFVPPYKGICHIVAHGYIGNSTTLQPMTAELQRIFDPLSLGSKAIIGSEGDANPANVIYELLTNNFGAASVPLTNMNTSSFFNAGQTLYDEDEGISIAYGSSPQQLSQTLQDILKQIDAVLYEDPETGLIDLTLIRDDYLVADLDVMDESNIKKVSNYTTNMWSDTKNRIRVKYEDRRKDYDDRTVVAEDMANVSFQSGQTKAISIQHPYIKRAEHANRKAASELAIYSTPLQVVSVQTLRFNTTIRPGTVLLMTFPEYNIQQLLVRVTRISFGDLINNFLTIDGTQDKFSKTDAVFGLPVAAWNPPYTGAAPIMSWTVEETPRWFNEVQSGSNPDNARFMAYPIIPTSNATGWNLWAKKSSETDIQQLVTGMPFASIAALTSSLSQTSTVNLVLQSVSNIDAIQTATVDQIQSLGHNLIQIDNEIMSFTSFTFISGIYTLTGINRGLLDTVQSAHSAGAYILFLDSSVVDPREFGGTDIVNVKMGSASSSTSQTVDQATQVDLTMNQRANRPLPPCVVEFDGVEYNPAIDNTSGSAVTWKRRDRLKDTISFHSDPDETPESGTHYWVKATSGGFSNTYDMGTGTSATVTFDFAGANTVEVYAVFDGLESTHLVFNSTIAHGAGVSVEDGIGTATTSAPTASVAISYGGPIGTATTSPPTATVTSSGGGHGDIGTVTTSAPTATVTISTVGSEYMIPGEDFFDDDGTGDQFIIPGSGFSDES